MSTTPAKSGSRRPQEVTVGAMLAVSGSIVAIVTLVSSMGRLHTVEMTDVLTEVMSGPGMDAFSLTIDDMRRIAKVIIMVLGVLSVTSAVLGVYVLRRDRVARVVLTALGSFVALFGLISNVAGWVLSAYIAMSLFLLWTRPAREWFRPERSAEPPPPAGWPSGPSGGAGPDDVWSPRPPPDRQAPPDEGTPAPGPGPSPGGWPAPWPGQDQGQPPPSAPVAPQPPPAPPAPPPGWRPPPKGWRPPPPKR